MATVKLALRDLSVPERVQFARSIVTAMTANPVFPAPIPSLTQVTTVADAVQVALDEQIAKQQAAQLATAAVNTKADELDAVLTSLGGYVQATTAGDETKILSAGMSVRGAQTALGRLPQAENLAASTGDMPGEVDLTWNRLAGAASYVLQYTTTDPNAPGATWVNTAPSTRSRATVTGLTSGTRYWFRVAGLGAAGQGPWSDPASGMPQ